jgi:hypothetical protein
MIKTRTFVNIPVVLVWQQKTVNIAALIVKLSRPGQRSLAGVGIRSVPAKLTEVETQIACFNVSHFSKRTGEIHEYRNDLNHPLSRVLIGRRRLVLWSALTSKRDQLGSWNGILQPGRIRGVAMSEPRDGAAEFLHGPVTTLGHRPTAD